MNQIIDKVMKLRPIDDIFFEKLVEDIDVCEEILRVILEDSELVVLSVTPQNSVRNLWGRSVRLDALCKMANGSLCNVEVQRADDDDHVRRVRYNEACITANHTKVGERFLSVPDVTMIFISTFDVFGAGRTIYHCRTMVDETKETVDNGLVEVYVNTKVKDTTEISELMECMLQEQVINAKFPKLSRRVQYLKNDEGGDGTMCEIVEEFAKEYALEKAMESIRNLFENGCLLEVVLASFPNVLEEDIRAIYAEVSAKQ